MVLATCAGPAWWSSAGIVWGAAIVGFGLTYSLPVALAFLALAGMGDLISEILRNTLLQHYTPDPLRGRVSSLYLAQVTTPPAPGAGPEPAMPQDTPFPPAPA